MRTLTRSLIAGAVAFAAIALPASASAATPDGWCKGPTPCNVSSQGTAAASPDWCSDTTSGAPCTIAPAAVAAQPASEDGWCLLPTDICRRY